MLCYNRINLDQKKYKPDYNKLKLDLPGLIHFYKLDYRKNPVFGIAYVKYEAEEDMKKILKMDFTDYFVKR